MPEYNKTAIEHDRTQEKIDKYLHASDILILKTNELIKNRDEQFLKAIKQKFGEIIYDKYMEKVNA